MKTPVYVAGFERGVRPIGLWSMSITLSMCSEPFDRGCWPGALAARRRAGGRRAVERISKRA